MRFTWFFLSYSIPLPSVNKPATRITGGAGAVIRQQADPHTLLRQQPPKPPLHHTKPGKSRGGVTSRTQRERERQIERDGKKKVGLRETATLVHGDSSVAADGGDRPTAAMMVVLFSFPFNLGLNGFRFVSARFGYGCGFISGPF
ncbi:hypothetical protein Hanom_Chr03g00197211 [Helianthus anomalus]